MTDFHAVMIDETGCEFGASLSAKDMVDAFRQLGEDYPESRIKDLRTCADWDDERDALLDRYWHDDEPEDDE